MLPSALLTVGDALTIATMLSTLVGAFVLILRNKDESAASKSTTEMNAANTLGGIIDRLNGELTRVRGECEEMRADRQEAREYAEVLEMRLAAAERKIEELTRRLALAEGTA